MDVNSDRLLDMPDYENINKNEGKYAILDEMTDKIIPDMVNHPPHYQSSSGLEVIDVIEAFTEHLTGDEATNTGNVIKYICRWKEKNGLEDLKKARWYLDRLIGFVGKKEESK